MLNAGVHLGGLLFSPSEIDTIKCQLLIKLHKIEEDTGKQLGLRAESRIGCS